MLSLSEKLLNLGESATLAMMAKAKMLLREAKDVISLSGGEPDFDTPECVKEAGIQAIRDNFSHYTFVNGIVELREAAARKFREENGIVGATAENTLICSGAKQCLFSTIGAICNPGDEVLVIEPYWVSYTQITSICGAYPIVITTEAADNYKLRPEQLARSFTPRTKAIIFSSPGNPSGMMYSEAEMRDLAEVLADGDCYVLSDEIYEKIIYGSVPHTSIGSIPSIADRVITINGVSKAYAMTGWRLGYMTGPDDVIRQAAKLQGQATSHPCSIAQKAALAALNCAGDDVERMRAAFERRRNLAVALLRDIPGINFTVPDGTFFLFLDVSSYLSEAMPDGDALCDFLLEHYLLALVPGSAFGTPQCIRISFAASEEDIERGLERFGRALTNLREGRRP